MRKWFSGASYTLLIIMTLIGAKTAHADLVFTVALNTMPLTVPPGSTAGPFSLAFALIQGSQPDNNSVTLNNFAFGVGGSAGSSCAFPPCTSGGASGDITSTVNLEATSFFNSFVESFNPGTDLTFNVDLTTNVDSGGTPDTFAFSILDGGGASIPTLDPSFADTLLTVNIDSASPAMLTYATDSSQPVNNGVFITMDAPTVTLVSTSVPEPSTSVVLGGLLAVLAALIRRGVTGLRT